MTENTDDHSPRLGSPAINWPALWCALLLTIVIVGLIVWLVLRE